ncbi:hypothetical protein CEE36_11000 [candidate division TA06 bacterium B3_TA06]|uniref:Uncharacterized protein n=1 Tax=candidate division TA06 bacterium B3_TA06 TaxID=2012487 RepID=A0A532URS5_UNCT6|nr:MAG: hypothetical protein CEE36_11000 [candidate division TA06 bacterium B3_TA06]
MQHPSVDSNTRTIYIESEESKTSDETVGGYYWSTHPGNSKVYHTYRNCVDGNNIECEYLESSFSPPAGYRKCEKCEILERSGYGEPGVPIPAS